MCPIEAYSIVLLAGLFYIEVLYQILHEFFRKKSVRFLTNFLVQATSNHKDGGMSQISVLDQYMKNVWA
ncbi:hypothetical protein BHU72_07095 [Desulfuribacillus stibiiarsenatis]|uniref:Uncharacterized protein n=1 Tax=Desulfuribacillus stibiiarsenatis TaxID=1390249 RepID=A0A1E5L4C9_9FIRM|nr:hypothetical protein BHU72_07095 [Desulfuribacillus stibiiarsenatis]